MAIIDFMTIKARLLTPQIKATLERGKSVLLLGARQTGKTTLIKTIKHDLLINFAIPRIRIQYETYPDLLEQTISGLPSSTKSPTNAPTSPTLSTKLPLIIIDEVQKVPMIMDLIQYLIDEKRAQFILTGSSARKLQNLLPGRVVILHLSPLTLDEMDISSLSIQDLLLYGTLPGIVNLSDSSHREADLASYVEIYLEEEIRREALVRNLSSFNRFLYLAAVESGNTLNLSKISQDIGVTHNTISAYYQILEDCLVAERIEPITTSASRKQLTKSPKILFFDLGLRRLAANEGCRLPEEYLGKLFEQFVGLELLNRGQLINPRLSLHYWRDANGPEVDWILNHHETLIPFEIKWGVAPKAKDIKHITTFCKEYHLDKGYLICRCSNILKLSEKIYAFPWQQLDRLVGNILI